MFVRALIAFLTLPGIVAFVIPAGLLWYTANWRGAYLPGLVLLAAGALALLRCTWDFYVSGKGTLAPWAPPQRLVTRGLYRYSRNPMYVAVALILLGWAISFASTVLFAYTLVVVAGFHIRVVFGEEPWLARTHGAEWEQYASRVPRWLW